METNLHFQSDDKYVRMNQLILNVKNEIHKVVIGQDAMIDLLLVGIVSGGHVLLEGVPGIAKTMTAKSLAKALDIQFNRIQFTPDLMPTDVLGTSIFNLKTSEFQFKKGPIFSNVVLIDEINRSPAKTQAALFEVMEEKQITIDGDTHILHFPFFVIATQNPIEQEGTYKLPEAQLDRFIFKIKMQYPTLEEEKQILHLFKNDFKQSKAETIQPVLSVQDLSFITQVIEEVSIESHLIDYIAALVLQTRNHPDLYLGASTRASLSILKASKALAAMRGRNFVIPEDIQFVAKPVMNHRIVLSPEKEMEGATPEDIIQSIIEKLEIPR
ncbi:MAG: MoxR family ATPase [Cytophagaceae bacterium]|jgi:MoxR-like ATPase|nr:MoxR family ATPase [Cytophagaceae bacterium]